MLSAEKPALPNKLPALLLHPQGLGTQTFSGCSFSKTGAAVCRPCHCYAAKSWVLSSPNNVSDRAPAIWGTLVPFWLPHRTAKMQSC